MVKKLLPGPCTRRSSAHKFRQCKFCFRHVEAEFWEQHKTACFVVAYAGDAKHWKGLAISNMSYDDRLLEEPRPVHAVGAPMYKGEFATKLKVVANKVQLKQEARINRYKHIGTVFGVGYHPEHMRLYLHNQALTVEVEQLFRELLDQFVCKFTGDLMVANRDLWHQMYPERYYHVVLPDEKTEIDIDQAHQLVGAIISGPLFALCGLDAQSSAKCVQEQLVRMQHKKSPEVDNMTSEFLSLVMTRFAYFCVYRPEPQEGEPAEEVEKERLVGAPAAKKLLQVMQEKAEKNDGKDLTLGDLDEVNIFSYLLTSAEQQAVRAITDEMLANMQQIVAVDKDTSGDKKSSKTKKKAKETDEEMTMALFGGMRGS